jgi:hypothetical protein
MVWNLVKIVIAGITVLAAHEMLAIEDRPFIQSVIFYVLLICFGFITAVVILPS